MPNFTRRDYLAEYLRLSPTLPSFALWRAIELRLLAPLDFPEPILDLGCGNGKFAELLLGKEREIIGLDLNWTDLCQARHSPAYRAVMCADATSLPCAEGVFGSVLANCVLEHIPADSAVVQEVARVLRPGGSFVFTVPAPGLKNCLYMPSSLRARGEIELAEAYLEEFDRRLAHFHYHSREIWSDKLGVAGFTLLQCEPYLPPPTVAVWDRLEYAFTQPVFRVLDRPELRALALCPRMLRTWLLYRFLRPHYMAEVQPATAHGCWLVEARKS